MKRATLGLLALLSMVACSASDSWTEGWQAYTDGLTRLLDREAQQPHPLLPFPHYPRGKTMAQQFSSPDINLLEFLRLGRCKLGQTLAQRNSILGKHGDAASLLVFDLQFLSQVDNCAISLAARDQHALADALLRAKKVKAQELPRRIFAASLAGAEFRELWSPPEQRKTYQPNGEDVAVAALQRWATWQAQWLAGNWSAGLEDGSGDALLTTLGEIRQGQGGQLLQAQRIAVSHLQRASDILQQRLHGRPLCLKPQPTPKANHLRALLQARFVGELQPRAARINRHQQQLNAAIAAIELPLFDAMEAVATEYLTWRGQRVALLEQATQAYREHVESASALLKQCGLSPGGN